jgi:hypothetical protein
MCTLTPKLIGIIRLEILMMRSKLEDRKGNQEQFLIGKNPVG